MNVNRKRLRSGILWIVLSPLALFMALIGANVSEISGVIEFAVLGTWSACGVASGLGTIAGALWAVRLQIVLSWIAFVFFTVPGAVLFYVAVFDTGDSEFGWMYPIAAGTLLMGIPFLLYAKNRQRELREERVVIHRRVK